jgi:hypothetical protein
LLGRSWRVQGKLIDASPGGEPIPTLRSFQRDGRWLTLNLTIGITDFGHNSSGDGKLSSSVLISKESSMDAHQRPIVTEENKVDVRAGSTGHHVRYILIGGVALAILAWILVEVLVRP